MIYSNLLKLVIFSLLIGLTSVCYAANVDTLKFYSHSIGKETKCVVITPKTYPKNKDYPVVYLLHGYSGNYANYIKSIPEIKDLVDNYQFIIVCPDGNKASWYLDSPIITNSNYESSIVKDLIPFIDENFETKKDKSGRAIVGLSMGGYGAMSLALKHQDLFGAVGTMSGGLDIRPFPNNWDLPQILGDIKSHDENWEKFTAINMIDLLKSEPPAIMIDCGIDDFFLQVNLDFHNRLIERKIGHDFILRPGSHNWKYWKNAIKYQLLFMNEYFQQNNHFK